MREVTQEFLEKFIIEQRTSLLPSQPKICIPIVTRIYRKMLAGIRFSEIKVYDGIICEGHHRYIASLLANYPLGQLPGIPTSASVAREWKSIVFEPDDWDTPAKVKMLNEQDALFNNVPMEDLVALLKD